MSPTSPPPDTKTPLAYNVPSVFTNFVHFTYVTGVFRVTFFEQHLSASEGSPEVREICAPRTSVTMAPATAAELLKSFGELYAKVAEGIRAGAGAMQPEDESGRLQ